MTEELQILLAKIYFVNKVSLSKEDIMTEEFDERRK